ncbi:glycosyl hydrolase family 65, N-terminal domain-containing protein [Aspergillus oleicola]
MCTLELDFGHNETSSYNRTLDLKTGIAEIQDVSQGTRFSRQAVASFPHGVLALKLSSTIPKSISFNMSLSRSQNVTSVSLDSNRAVTLRGTSSADKSISFATQARLVAKGGTVTSIEDKTLVIKDADEAWIYVNGETSWRHPLGPAEYEAALKRTIDQAVSLGWNKILECAVEDYQGLAGRVSLDLGGSGIPGTAATDQRIKAWRAGANFTADPELLTLMFNYGRYYIFMSTIDSNARTSSPQGSRSLLWKI